MRFYRRVSVRGSRPDIYRGPSFWLFLIAATILLISYAALLRGCIGFSTHLCVGVPVYFLVAMCVHDAIHRAAHQNSVFNNATGWLGSVSLGLTFSVIRRSHLKHHQMVGHDEDIESNVYAHAWAVPLRVLSANWRCYAVFPSLKPIEKTRAIVLLVVICLTFTVWPIAALIGWLIPMQLGVAAFTFLTVYLPHGRPASWVLKWVPAITGFHDFHHAVPQYPWYQCFSMRFTGGSEPNTPDI